MSSVAPKYKIALYSPEFFGICCIGGTLSCGLTHMAVTPLDLVKCNMQANPKEFPSLGGGLKNIYKARGFSGLFTGWVPTLFGYSVQGCLKFGLYEYFKYKYAGAFAPETAHKYRDLIYLSASASAEFFADIGLACFESVKVRMQTTLDPVTLKPQIAGLRANMAAITGSEGVGKLYAGLPPLWMRQIPYTMMKFFGFERAVELIYKNLPKKKEEYNKFQQLLVSFAGGYLAGIFCAAVSHPADTVVSILNKNKTMTIGQILRETPKKTLFTKGLGTRILMIGTLTGLQWLIYDTFKASVGLPTAGGAKLGAPVTTSGVVIPASGSAAGKVAVKPAATPVPAKPAAAAVAVAVPKPAAPAAPAGKPTATATGDKAAEKAKH